MHQLEWRENRIMLPLQAPLTERKVVLSKECIADNQEYTPKVIVIEDANCNVISETISNTTSISELEQQRHLDEEASNYFLEWNDGNWRNSVSANNSAESKSNSFVKNTLENEALTVAREEIINLLNLNLNIMNDADLVRDGFVVSYEENLGDSGCHVGDSYATITHLLLYRNKLCLKSGSAHFSNNFWPICHQKHEQQEEEQEQLNYSEHHSTNILEHCKRVYYNVDDDYYDDDDDYYNSSHEDDDNNNNNNNYNNSSGVKHYQVSTEEENVETLQQQEELLKCKDKSSRCPPLRQLPIYTTRWQRESTFDLEGNATNSEATSLPEDVDLSTLHRIRHHRSEYGVNSAMEQFTALSRSEVHKFMIVNGGSEITWLAHCPCVKEINVDVICADDWNEHCSVVGLSNGSLVVTDWRCKSINPVLESSVPRPPWEYTTRSRVISPAMKYVSSASIATCAAFDANYRVLCGLNDHYGSLVISDLRRPSKESMCTETKLHCAYKPNKPLLCCQHSREKWEKLMWSEFINGAGCLFTGHPISSIVHCPTNIDRVGLVDVHGQAMCLSMNALEHGECYLWEANPWQRENKLQRANVLQQEQQHKESLQEELYRKRQGNAGTHNYYHSNVNTTNSVATSNIRLKRSRESEILNCNSTTSKSYLQSELWLRTWQSILEPQHIRSTNLATTYDRALESLFPLLNADEQAILRLQNVHMQLESRRNKIARRCVFTPNGEFLIHSTNSLLGVSVEPMTPLTTPETKQCSSAFTIHPVETFRVHHNACCRRKGDAIVNMSMTCNNVLAVTTMMGQTWSIPLTEYRKN